MRALIIVHVICFIIGALLLASSDTTSWEETDFIDIFGLVIFVFGGLLTIPIASLIHWINKKGSNK